MTEHSDLLKSKADPDFCLLPCPFCGSSATLDIGNTTNSDISVCCSVCGVNGVSVEVYSDYHREVEIVFATARAIAKWNKRV